MKFFPYCLLKYNIIPTTDVYFCWKTVSDILGSIRSKHLTLYSGSIVSCSAKWGHWLPWDNFWYLCTVEQEWKWQRPVLELQVFSRVWYMLLHAFIFVQFWKTGKLRENCLIKLVFQDDSSSRMNFQSLYILKDRTETDSIQVESRE